MTSRTQILWNVHVWRADVWRSWCGDSGDLRLSGLDRDHDAERHCRSEAERLAELGRVVRLSRLGETITIYNMDKLDDVERNAAHYAEVQVNQ